jgi:hypothetical protein
MPDSAQVDKHCLSCLACWVLTCVDCSKDFEGEAFRAHTSCMSEAEKYQGKLYVESSKVSGLTPDRELFSSRCSGIDLDARAKRILKMLG